MSRLDLAAEDVLDPRADLSRPRVVNRLLVGDLERLQQPKRDTLRTEGGRFIPAS